MSRISHRTTFAEQFLVWQCMTQDGECVLVASLQAIGGMTIALPLNEVLAELPFSDPNWVIIIDRIERMFWNMHGSALCDRPGGAE